MSEPILNARDLDALAQSGQATLYPTRLKILVGSASCGVAMGAPNVEAAARRAVEELRLDAIVSRTGCIGFCAKEPLLDLVLPNGPRVSYPHMTPKKTRALLEGYCQGNLQPELALGRFTSEEIAARKTQVAKQRTTREFSWRYAFFGLLGALLLGLIAWPGVPLDRKMYSAVHGVCFCFTARRRRDLPIVPTVRSRSCLVMPAPRRRSKRETISSE